MTRGLFNFGAVVSLLLAMATAALWVHSRNQWDVAWRDDQRKLVDSSLWLLAGSRGTVWVYHERYDARMRQNWGPRLDRGVRSAGEPPFELVADPTWNSGEDEFRHRWPAWVHSGPASNPFEMLIVPTWCLLAIFALLPAVRVGLWIRLDRRRKAGLCATCGYDLRASAVRCPECGTQTPSRL